MKVLFVVPYVPSLIRVRPYNLIRALAARGHDVTVATIWTDDREQRELEELRAGGVQTIAVHLPSWQSLLNCVRALPTGEPLQARYSWSPELLSQIERLVPAVDVVHVEHLRGVHYARAAAATTAGTPVIWDSVDCISHLFEQAAVSRTDAVGRVITRLELSRTKQIEGAQVGAFDRVLVSSGVDRESMLALAGTAQRRRNDAAVTVLSNGVDLDYFFPVDEPRRPDTLVFSGKMSYHANESAVIQLVGEIMPRVWAARPQTQLIVVGKDPSAKLRRLLAAEPSRITVTGTVPDLRPFLRHASVAVVPLVYGAGCQNKVLEAMACGTPVVATSRAVSALKVQRGRDVLVADGADAFAGAVLELLGDSRRQTEIGHAGRRYVEMNHRWDHVAGQLEAIYGEAIAARRPAARRRESLLSA